MILNRVSLFDGSLHVIQELVIVFLVHPAADPHHNDHVGQHEQMEPDRWNGGLYDDFAEVPNEQVHRVQKEQVFRHGGIVVDGVKNRGHIHQEHGEHAPEVLNVPEEDKKGREDQAYPDVEHHQHANWVEQADELPGEGDVVDHTEHKKDAQCQAKVDKGLDVLGEKEQILGHVDLGEDPGVAHKGGHALTGGLVEVGEDQVAAEEVGSVMGGSPAEKLREDQPHDQQGQQRGQHAPGHAQHRAFVFLFEITFDQFLEEELVMQ